MSKTSLKNLKENKSSVMEDLLARFSKKTLGFNRSQRIEATFEGIEGKKAIFNVGGKSEGIVTDLAFQEARDYIKTLKIGDKVQAIVLDPENREGYVILSLRHAASDSLWDALTDAEQKQTELTVSVKNASNAGLVVDYAGVSGFIPMSQLGRAVAGNVDAFVGRQIKVKIADIDRDKRKVVFSEKYVSEADELVLQNEALAKLEVGKVYSGSVVTITDFGAFVTIPVDVVHGKTRTSIPVEGLVHLSELSWEKFASVSSVVSIGDKINVKVISNDGKLALSIRLAKEDPWATIGEKYHVDDKIKGKVMRITEFGAIVNIESGVEGLIHITKIPPAQKLKIGDEVNCYIEELDTKTKKISLGLILSAKTMIYK